MYKLEGVFTALITPFDNNQIDEKSLVKLVETQISSGISGIVPCGTTGESPTLTEAEQQFIIELSAKIAKGKIPIIAGAGSNSTEKTITLCKNAEKAGADILMLIVPYYNKPTQEGLYQHFKYVARSVNLPIIIYNNPSRTAVDLHDITLSKLVHECNNIIGIKDASGDLTRPMLLHNMLEKEFSYLSGDDATALSFNAAGGNGCISVISNIIPELCVKLQNLWNNNKIKEAIALQSKLMPLCRTMFCESNPVPVKYAASLLGICKTDVRLPLVLPSVSNQKLIQDSLISLGILKNSNI
ncbi:dihydrodipicolinate synthase [Rickettsiales bacterium Ac37b]|nr:dihydrodipicolinate synthase [Rickettsiales bacterium Ac37b]